MYLDPDVMDSSPTKYAQGRGHRQRSKTQLSGKRVSQGLRRFKSWGGPERDHQ